MLIKVTNAFKASLLCISIWFLFGYSIKTTGPIEIDVKLNPIAINDSGQVLCRYHIFYDPHGSFGDDEFGLCVLTNRKIEHFSLRLINLTNTENIDLYFRKLNFWKKKYQSCINWEQPTTIEKRVIEKYNFTKCNIDSFKKDTIISYEDFTKT